MSASLTLRSASKRPWPLSRIRELQPDPGAVLAVALEYSEPVVRESRLQHESRDAFHELTRKPSLLQNSCRNPAP